MIRVDDPYCRARTGPRFTEMKILNITHPTNISIVVTVGLILNLCGVLLIHGAFS